jgi:hypothetical protein
MFEKHTFDDENVMDIDDPERGFFAQARAGTLPNVSFVEPRFIELPPGSNCDGPPGDVKLGQDFVSEVVEAVVSSPAWDKTLMLLIYDEHGGFYDHVPPPAAVRVSPELPIDIYGARVPSFVISPWVSGGSVFGSGTPGLHFDHTSVLKTIARRFLSTNPPYLSARYAAASDLSEVIGTQPRSRQFRPFIRYGFRFNSSQFSLGAKDGVATEGAELWQLAADGSAAQDFSFEDAGGGAFYLRNRVSNLYLTANLPVPVFPPKPVPTSVVLETKHRSGTSAAVDREASVLDIARQKWILIPVLGPHPTGDLFLVGNLALPGKVLQPAQRTTPGPVVMDRNGSIPNTGLLNAWKIDSPLLA